MTISNDTAGPSSSPAPNPLPVDAARARIQRAIAPVATVERVALRAALDRVLAEDIVSPIDVPAHDNAAMDGYAFDGTALAAATAAGSSTAQLTLAVAGEARAGHPFARASRTGECVRIMTGVVLTCWPAWT